MTDEKVPTTEVAEVVDRVKPMNGLQSVAAERIDVLALDAATLFASLDAKQRQLAVVMFVRCLICEIKRIEAAADEVVEAWSQLAIRPTHSVSP